MIIKKWEKIKSLFLLEPIWFLIIFLLVSIDCILWLFGYQIFIDAISKFFPWDGWDTISAIALIITAVVIGFQSYYTKKYTEFAVTPSVFFTIRSIMRLNLERNFRNIIDLSKKEKLIKEKLNKMSLDEKLKTHFIVKNNSKFPTLFRVKIDYEYEERIIKSFNHYWKKPLYIYPSGMMYPGVIILKDVIDIIGPDKDYKGKTIIAHITYNYSPGFAPKIKCGPFPITWVFDLEEFKWSGPDGVQEENLYPFEIAPYTLKRE